MIVRLTGHLTLVRNLSGPESESRSSAELHILPLRRDRHLHLLLSMRVRRQPSHEEEELADGPAQVLHLLTTGPARRLHLLFELVEVLPELGDPLVGHVLARAAFPEPLLELAELSLDPVQRQARRPV
jgi:hypothetical protein